MGSVRRDVERRLEVLVPEHHPDDPYELKEVYDAANYVLHGTDAGATAAAGLSLSTESLLRETIIKNEAHMLQLVQVIAQKPS